MSEDFNGGASAPAETNSAATPEAAPPNPIRTDPLPSLPEPEPAAKDKAKDDKAADKPAEKAPTAREALKKAAEKVARDSADDGKKEAALNAGPKAAEKPAEKVEGKDAPKDAGKDAKAQERPADAAKPASDPAQGQPVKAEPVTKPAEGAKTSTHEPPARFSPDAKAAWETAPDPVKAEVHRAIRELEQGVQKYKPDAEAYSQVKEFDELAKKNNTSLRDAMTRYTNLERTLLTNPLDGIKAVCDYAGVSLRDLAAHVMGQKPEQVQSQNDATIRQLSQELAQLKQQVGGVTSTMQQQHISSIDEEVADFAAQNPRFEELADDIAFFIDTKKAKDLPEAYRLAERLNPAPAASASAAPAAPLASAIAPAATKPDLEAQTLKGSKSVSGAPGPGSDLGKPRASTSIKDSLRRAVAQIG